MRILFLTLLGVIYSIELNAQDKPYFQQRVNYVINVTLDDTLHELVATEKIRYYNQSPDTLTVIYIHLWANGYRDRNTAMAKQFLDFGGADFHFAARSQYGFIDRLDFTINGKNVPHHTYKRFADIAEIILNEPLLPGDSMMIETPFRVKIPGDFSRLGHRGQGYQISQWYPKVAVYDRQGWQMFPYLNIGEFYGDFGSYDVFITLPDNYYVASTGIMVDDKEELKRIEKRISDSKNKFCEWNNDFSKSSLRSKTLHFHQDSIHDFAWFADKRFLIAKREVLLPESRRKVAAYAFYLPQNAPVWEKVPHYISRALDFYSEKLGEYPYGQCTAVDGALDAGGGMEYPMIAVINSVNDPSSTEQVVLHEVGHNWFYGVLAFNERKYPWLDEGLASFYENECLNRYYPTATLQSQTGLPPLFDLDEYPDFYSHYFAYLFTQSQFDYQPMGLPSDKYSMFNYGVSAYFTPVIMFRYLKSYLGEAAFDQIMLQFASEWRFKHPLPSDIKHFFEENSGKDLDWFFDTLVNTAKPIDMRLCGLKPIKGTDGGCLLKTRDVSRLGAPFAVSVLDKGGVVLTQKWVESAGGDQTDTLFMPAQAYKVAINYPLAIPEVDKRDNQMRIHGLFRKQNRPRLSFLWSMSDPAKTSVFYLPVAGWNYYNGWMFGMALYSDPIVPPKWDYRLMPMFSFGAKSIAGSAEVGCSVAKPLLHVKMIRLGLLAKQYNNLFMGDLNHYAKVEPSLLIQFETPSVQNIVHELKFRNVYVNQTTATPTLDSYTHRKSEYGKNRRYSILNLQYSYQKKRIIDPWSVKADAQLLERCVKVSVEFRTQYTFAKKKGVDLRFFFGKMANPSVGFFPNMNFNASGISSGYNGFNDYLFDHTLMGRSENHGFLSHQMMGNDGGFVTPTALGQTNDWLMAVNVRMNVPWKLPLRLFGNIATFSNAKRLLENGEVFIYEAGVTLVILREIAEISIPLLISNDMRRVMDLNSKKYYERIRFIINLDAINPYKVIKNYKQLM